LIDRVINTSRACHEEIRVRRSGDVTAVLADICWVGWNAIVVDHTEALKTFPLARRTRGDDDISALNEPLNKGSLMKCKLLPTKNCIATGQLRGQNKWHILVDLFSAIREIGYLDPPHRAARPICII
jgi:hypothetical protein